MYFAMIFSCMPVFNSQYTEIIKRKTLCIYEIICVSCNYIFQLLCILEQVHPSSTINILNIDIYCSIYTIQTVKKRINNKYIYFYSL